MKEQIKNTIAELLTIAKQKGAELDISEEDFIDDEHLNCVWYGGKIAVVKYKDMTIKISVHGEVRIWVEYLYEGTYISDVADEDNVLDAIREILDVIEDKHQCYLEAITPCGKCSRSVNGDCELSPDDNACNGTAGEMDEYAYCTAVPAENTSPATKDFVFTYSVEGYVEVRVSANSLEEARKIATVKAGEIDCGNLRDVDWNELEVMEE